MGGSPTVWWGLGNVCSSSRPTNFRARREKWDRVDLGRDRRRGGNLFE